MLCLESQQVGRDFLVSGDPGKAGGPHMVCDTVRRATGAANLWGPTRCAAGWALPEGRATDRDSKRCRDAGAQGAKDPSIKKTGCFRTAVEVGDRWWGLAHNNGSDAAYPCFHVVIA